MLFSATTTENSVYEFRGVHEHEITALCELSVSIERVNGLRYKTWTEIYRVLGAFATIYLHLRYSRSDARILIARRDGAIAHLQWIVPESHIGKRYSFVSPGGWAVISCLTAEDCRGMGIYPAMLQLVVKSGISKTYLIWADNRNVASIRGIERAGGHFIGSFIQRKRLKGLVSKVIFEKAVDDRG